MPEIFPAIHFSSQYGAPSCCDQCDCACPTYDVVRSPARFCRGSETFQQSEVYASDLAPTHRLLFNLTRGRDVAVVNQAAYRLWEQFKSPRQLAGLNALEREIAQLSVSDCAPEDYFRKFLEQLVTVLGVGGGIWEIGELGRLKNLCHINTSLQQSGECHLKGLY